MSGLIVNEITDSSGNNKFNTTLGTEQATTSGTSIDFTGFPSGVKEIKVMFTGVSTNGANVVQLQLGDSGGIETTGYLGACGMQTAATNHSVGFETQTTHNATDTLHGIIILSLEDSAAFTWCCTGGVSRSDSTASSVISGSKTLSSELTQVRVTSNGGTDTFDAGAINIQYSF